MPISEKLKGRYELHEVLGHGGMGIIYRAYDVRVKRMVALKTIRDVPDSLALELFQRETDILAQLCHPNIVEIFDAGEFSEDGVSKPYFVMPLLKGRTLDEVLRGTHERLSIGRAVEILCQAAKGLHAAHELGLVHRDLKPSNIFVLDDDWVKIIDFGLAHMISGLPTVGRKGTLHYMAPEQIAMEAPTAKSDQFGLGVVSYQLLAGRRPFDGPTEQDVARATLHHVPPLICEVNASVSRPLSQVVHKALAKKPRHRWESLRDYAAALQMALRGQPIASLDLERASARIQRAARALEHGDTAFAEEIIHDLEEEGFSDSTLSGIREQLDQQRQQARIRELLSSARMRVEEQEDLLALDKIDEILKIDIHHGEALALRQSIEARQSEARRVVIEPPLERHGAGGAGITGEAPAREGSSSKRISSQRLETIWDGVKEPAPDAVPTPPPRLAATPASRPPVPVVAGLSALFLVLAGVSLWHPWTSRVRRPVPAIAPSAPVAVPPKVAEAVPAKVAEAVPAKFRFQFFTDAAEGSIALDHRAPTPLKDGAFAMDELTPGEHEILIRNPKGAAKFLLDADPKNMLLKSDMAAPDEFLAVLMYSNAGDGLVRANRTDTKASVDYGTLTVIEPDGMKLVNLLPGRHTIALLNGKNRSSFDLEIGEAPTLTMFIRAAHEIASLVLRADEEGANVLLNGTTLKKLTGRGETRIYGLRPGSYMISLAKPGFEAVLPQRVEIAQGQTASLRFELKRIPPTPPPPQLATLAMSGATGGAEVLLDRVRVGFIANDGTFTLPNIGAGAHLVEMRRDGFIPKSLTLRFEAGAIVSITGNDARMTAEPKPATIRVSVVPANANVTYTRPNEPEVRVDPAQPLVVPKGSVAFHATAQGYRPLDLNVTVVEGETRDVALELTREAPSDLMAGWDSRSWVQEGTSYVHEGAGFVLFGAKNTAGTISFNAFLRKGKRIHWILSFQDVGNYAAFELDGKYFYRVEVRKGKRNELARTALNVEIAKPVAIQIRVGNGLVLNSINGRVIDTWNEPARVFPEGKFGFLLPGQDTIVISGFSYVAQ